MELPIPIAIITSITNELEMQRSPTIDIVEEREPKLRQYVTVKYYRSLLAYWRGEAPLTLADGKQERKVLFTDGNFYITYFNVYQVMATKLNGSIQEIT